MIETDRANLGRLLNSPSGEDTLRKPDILVLGGNPGGCSAAVIAARMGANVVLMEASQTLGGNNANGVFAFDTSDPSLLRGIAEEVEKRVNAWYDARGIVDHVRNWRADTVWESHVAAEVWADLVAAEGRIEVLTRAVAINATVKGNQITSVRWVPAATPSGDPVVDEADAGEVRAALVIDASYEGDILEWTGVPYRIGRECRSRQEPHAGRIFTSDAHFGRDGYLPHSVLPGSSGEADDAIMSFACRLHCRWYHDTRPDAPHRIATPPPDYDPGRYEWAPQGYGADGAPRWFTSIYLLAGEKVLLNRTVRGNEVSGAARDYILAHPRKRGTHRKAIENIALGFLYYVQTEGGCPGLGLATDEFTDNGNVPYRLYVREGRRIIGAAEMSETSVSPFIEGDGTRPPFEPDSIAVGDWPLESRACSDTLEEGYRHNEGWLFARIAQAPYQVPYGCLLPQKIGNLLVCGSVSATHLGFGAVRVESTRIHLGMAAGSAAALALSSGLEPSAVPVPEIQEALLAAGAQLIHFSDLPSSHPDFAAIQRVAMRGVVPRSELHRFHPDATATWADAAETVVKALGLPISVTGEHFERIGRGHPKFRFFEALYDFGSRAGIDLFGVSGLTSEHPIRSLLRQRGHALIPLEPDDPIGERDLRRLLTGLAEAAAVDAEVDGGQVQGRGEILTRGKLMTIVAASPLFRPGAAL